MKTDYIDFGSVKDDLSGAQALHTMQVLVRDNLWSAHSHHPAALVLTDEFLYYGGNDPDRGFTRIALEDVTESTVKGRLFWRCLEVKHKKEDKMEIVYFCPFNGEHHKPEIDDEGLNELKKLIEEYTR